MCGRFALAETPRDMAKAFDVEPPAAEPRYNVSPGRTVPVLVHDPDKGGAEFQGLFWGLVPFWAADTANAGRLINARSETVQEKRAFRGAFRHRRCLIPASGFYEWKREGTVRTPYYFFSSRSGGTLALAGIWEDWIRGDRFLRSFAILTTDANELMRPVHDRMPAIVPPGGWRRWLDPRVQRRDEVEDLLRPPAPEMLAGRRVGGFVNRAGNEGPECIREVRENGGQGAFSF